MNQKKKFGFLLLVFCFLSLTRLSGAQSSSIVGTATDQQWFQFMAVNAFELPGLDIKIPLVSGELNLSADEQREIENLFSNHGDEALLSQMTAPISGGSPDDSEAPAPSPPGEARDLGVSNPLIKRLDAPAPSPPGEARNLDDPARIPEENSGCDTTEGGDDDPVRIMIQVKLVRKLLGDRDLDFRFWFYEETLIDAGEDSAYRENQNYSEDELAENLLASIERTQEFRDFKDRKILFFHSADKVENYLADWEALFESRVLLQIHQVMRRG